MLGPMNRQSLRDLLHREGVDPHAYSLSGERSDECLILDVEPGGWYVSPSAG
jgi:hypothetical protein